MALAPFRLPPMPSRMVLMDPRTGTVSGLFQRWWNVDLKLKIEEQEQTQTAEITRLNGVVHTLNTRLTQIEAAQSTANAAHVAANKAQATADAAQAGTTSTTARSGEATDPDVDLSGTAWAAGPQVDLLTVSAGDLTITGSTPLSNPGAHIMNPAGGSMAGEFRIVEIVSAVETVLFTGTFTAADETTDEPSPLIIVSNHSATDVQNFKQARVSTGSVSYRLDMRRVSGATSTLNLRSYLYVRRA